MENMMQKNHDNANKLSKEPTTKLEFGYWQAVAMVLSCS